jgi:hypothetical protein
VTDSDFMVDVERGLCVMHAPKAFGHDGDASTAKELRRIELECPSGAIQLRGL